MPTLSQLLPDDLRGEPGFTDLRNVFASVLAGVRALAPDLAGASLTAEGIARGGPKVAQAAQDLFDWAAAHQSIRLAQLRLLEAERRRGGAPRPQADPPTWPNPYLGSRSENIPTTVGWFFDSAAFPTVMPGTVVPMRTTAPRPGPDEPVARLLWLATDADAQPWLPTPDEQDARFREFVAYIAELRRDRHAAERLSRSPWAQRA